MSMCHVCHGTKFQETVVDEFFYIQGKPILVEKIPATMCYQYGELTFSRETTEKIRQMLQENAQPQKLIQMDVFVFR